MLDVLHWLPAQQHIEYRVVSLVWQCQLAHTLAMQSYAFTPQNLSSSAAKSSRPGAFRDADFITAHLISLLLISSGGSFS